MKPVPTELPIWLTVRRYPAPDNRVRQNAATVEIIPDQLNVFARGALSKVVPPLLSFVLLFFFHLFFTISPARFRPAFFIPDDEIRFRVIECNTKFGGQKRIESGRGRFSRRFCARIYQSVKT